MLAQPSSFSMSSISKETTVSSSTRRIRMPLNRDAVTSRSHSLMRRHRQPDGAPAVAAGTGRSTASLGANPSPPPSGAGETTGEDASSPGQTELHMNELSSNQRQLIG